MNKFYKTNNYLGDPVILEIERDTTSFTLCEWYLEPHFHTLFENVVEILENADIEAFSEDFPINDKNLFALIDQHFEIDYVESGFDGDVKIWSNKEQYHLYLKTGDQISCSSGSINFLERIVEEYSELSEIGSFHSIIDCRHFLKMG